LEVIRLIHHLVKNKKSYSLEEQVLAAQEGDKRIRNQLLKKYQPFIAKSVSEVCKKYIDPKRDDEYSIGLIAFDRAIESYSHDRGTSFLSFAKLIVKRKVIDYLRSENRQSNVISINDEHDEEENMENPQEIKIATDRYAQETDAWQRRIEIAEYKDALEKYNIRFAELPDISPKHRDARISAIHVAKTLFFHKNLRSYVIEKKRIPINELIPHVDVSRKTIERNRKYILAIFVLLCGDYVYLKDYIKEVNL
jgi:RNA polymerase sigma factor